ncbi:MAG: NAD(P)-dependent oxidoreductase [Chloroflexi bacterium]|nr:NAD(P)-dependent oxidoreductase [Chloroflexota bacterium]MQC17157.1 NAD(P)-dependent oxidoreductase [Chloroflexota bacterium]
MAGETPDQQKSANEPAVVRPAVDRKARFKIPAHRPDKQPAPDRINNWDEVYHLFTESAARIEAERCIQCPAAPCQKACPVHNDIPGALWLLEQGDFGGAANIFRETSELPEMCGRLCPQERLCEGHCVVGKNALPVAIGKLETFTTEWQQVNGGAPQPASITPTGRTVAVIGAGPAGIAVAERLARRGHSVTMYDAWPEPGGVLRYGIPNFKLNKPSVDRKFDELRALGVDVRCGVRVGEDLAWDELRHDVDAIFVGIGASEGARLRIPGEDAEGVITATEFLVRSNLPPEELPEPLRLPLGTPQQVVVVGGGDTSMDCVRSARRLGADDVTLVYRRTEAEMQGRIEERTHAVEEGVQFEYLAAPLEVLTDANGRACGLRCVRMQLGEPDDTGRRSPEPIEGSEFEIPADLVVTAIGYNVDPEWGEVVSTVNRDRWGRLVVDPETMQTNLKGVFAGGDDVNGADLVVTALADGHRAADAIHDYLRTLMPPTSDLGGPLVGDSSLL